MRRQLRISAVRARSRASRSVGGNPSGSEAFGNGVAPLRARAPRQILIAGRNIAPACRSRALLTTNRRCFDVMHDEKNKKGTAVTPGYRGPCPDAPPGRRGPNASLSDRAVKARAVIGGRYVGGIDRRVRDRQRVGDPDRPRSQVRRPLDQAGSRCPGQSHSEPIARSSRPGEELTQLAA